MYEARSPIGNIAEMRKKVQSLGAQLLGGYRFVDIIFMEIDKRSVDLNIEVVRLRVSRESHTRTPKALVTEKSILWSGSGCKQDRIRLSSPFETPDEAIRFIEIHYSGTLERSFEYSREGWVYCSDNTNFYIEDIALQNFSPSIEVEAEEETELTMWFALLDLREIYFNSVPELVRRHLAGIPPEVLQIS